VSDVSSDFPTVVDDLGDGRSGTRIDEAWQDDVIDAINEQTLSATNPTVTPADTIDEVVTARGSTGALNTRISLEHNADGTHKATGTIANYATVTQVLGAVGAKNLIVNDDDQIWVLGDDVAPTGSTLTGTGAASARCGTARGDTERKVGDFCARLTRGTTDAALTETLLSGASFVRAEFLKSLYACGGCWVKCATANAARIGVYDGVGYTYSAYHTGGGTWEWLPVSRQINVAATGLYFLRCVNNAAVAAYFSGRTLMILSSSVSLPRYIPSDVVYGTAHFGVSGNLVAATALGRFIPSRMGLIKDIQADVKTCPTGATVLAVDINTYDGTAATSLFGDTKLEFVASEYDAGKQPDGTYARRCVTGGFGNTIAAGQRITMDIDDVGSTIAGSDIGVEVRMLQYQSPLERFWGYNG
jgi:hypothetical protein